MSFLKITDPKKRDIIVEEFLKSKKNIQQNYLSERLGDIGLQRELTKLYKPITETQKGLQEALKTDLGSIKENLQALPTSLKAILPAGATAIQFPQYPSIEAYSDDPVEDIRTLELGDLATKYLHQYASSKRSVDTTFGIHSKDGIFYVGNTPITIQGDDIIIGDKTYIGTPGLWELLTMAKPDPSIWIPNDIVQYAEILKRTNAMIQPNNPTRPKSSRSDKYKTIIKHIWDEHMLSRGTASRSTSTSSLPSSPTVGRGVIVIPKDPNALAEMLCERMASFKAGNTGVRNEIVSIGDELLRQGVINKGQYKKIMLQI